MRTEAIKLRRKEMYICNSLQHSWSIHRVEEIETCSYFLGLESTGLPGIPLVEPLISAYCSSK